MIWMTLPVESYVTILRSVAQSANDLRFGWYLVLPLESYVAADCNAASGRQPMAYDSNGTPNQIVCCKPWSDGCGKSQGGVQLP